LDHRYFANEHTYGNLEPELLTAYLQGNLEKTSEIAESVDLRRIPLHQGKSDNIQLSSEFRNHPWTLWPVPLLMLFAQNVPQKTMIDFLHGIIESGFNIRQALRIQENRQTDAFPEPRDAVADGAALLIAIEKTELEVLTYLLGKDFINIWEYSHL
jgi:hypothetical protein